MICAICLRLGGKIMPRDETESLARSAITISNGHALCREHLDALADWETPDGAAVALLGSMRIITDAQRADEP